MRVNEIKETIERVVRVEYISEDGQVFYNEEECKKYAYLFLNGLTFLHQWIKEL